MDFTTTFFLKHNIYLQNTFNTYNCWLYLVVVVLSIGDDVCVNIASAALENTATQQETVTAASASVCDAPGAATVHYFIII